MAIKDWSTTAGSNTSSPPNGAPEGWAPSAVNNTIREIMAQVRGWYEDPAWVNYGYTYTYVASTQFKITGSDVTARFPVGRRVRAVGSSTGTIYGSITVSSFSTDTTITVSWDSGSLSNETLQVSVGMPSSGFPLSGALLALSALTADATPTSSDYLVEIDVSDSNNPKKTLISDFLKVVAGLTAETSVDTDADLLLLLDAGGSNAAKKVTPKSLGGVLGKHAIWVPASAMISRTTNGAASGTVESTTYKIMLKTLDFDAATDEFAQFAVQMPKSWNEGTVTAQFVWSAASGDGDCVWACQAVALSDADTIDAAFGTEQTVTDNDGTSGTLRISAETSAITIAGTPAAGDVVVFQIFRDANNGSDTFSADARLHGVTIFYTVDAGNDA